MITAEQFVSAQQNKLLQIQYILGLAESAAASHTLKSDIRNQIAALDMLENHFQTISLQRGWELSELEPIERLRISIRFRCRNDARIAEYLIRLYNRDSMMLIKLYNRCEQDDSALRNLFQKLMDQYTVGTRQMQQFL